MTDVQREDRLAVFDDSIFKKEYGYIPSTAFTGITAFADYDATVSGTVKATRAAHGLATGDVITQSGTTNYNGDFAITVIDEDNYYFTDTWVSDDAAGQFVYLAANQGNIQWVGKAMTNVLRSAPSWQITRFIYDANSDIIRSVFPKSGTKETNGFQFVWNNKETLLYGAE
jgi:hypothetical protein